MKSNVIGIWRIESMELWDNDFIDLVEEGKIELRKEGTGSLVFGAVQGEIDYSMEEGINRIDFSWEGFDEGDPVSGRGWAEIKDEKMKGKIYFHYGDNSEFEALKR
jgi:hypothetical protein